MGQEGCCTSKLQVVGGFGACKGENKLTCSYKENVLCGCVCVHGVCTGSINRALTLARVGRCYVRVLPGALMCWCNRRSARGSVGADEWDSVSFLCPCDNWLRSFLESGVLLIVGTRSFV